MSFGINFDRMRQLRNIAQNPSESDLVDAVATIQSNLEHDLLDAVEDLHDALNVEDPVRVDATREERKEALLDAAEAAADREFAAYWFRECTTVDNPEDAADVAGLDPDAWSEQIEAWARAYRRHGADAADGMSDRELAAHHVETTFGVPLDTFEREVVGYSQQHALKHLLAGNLTAGIEGVETAAEAARQQRGGGA